MQTLPGLQSGFLLVLNSEGTDLVYGTYLGGEKISRAWAVCVDDDNNAYVQGITNSVDFPVTDNAFQKDKDGIDWDGNVSGSDIDYQNSFDLFISKINIISGKLLYSTYFGGRGSDSTYGTLAINKKGVVYFSGSTTSLDLKTTDNAFRKYHDVGLYDSFLTALDINNNNLLFSSYIGGNDSDDGEALYLDDNGYLYFVGDTWSSNFPTSENAYQKDYKGVGESISGGDIFAMKINTNDWKLVYSTLLGGSFDEGVRAITVDDEGNLYIGGMTQSTDYPVTSDAFQKVKKGPKFINISLSTDYDFLTHDTCISKLNADGSKLLYSTYFGGRYGEFILGMTLNKGGFIVQLRTYSDDLFVSPNAYQKFHGNDKFNLSMLNRSEIYDIDNYFAIFSNPSFLTISSLKGNTGDVVTLTGTLKESMGNNSLKNKVVKFYINGNFVGSSKTNEKGIASLDYKITEKGGNYLYTASYEGGLGHEEANAYSNLLVPQSEVFLSIISNASNLKVGDTVKITYTLTNNGPDASEGVSFSYTLPKGLQFLSNNANLGNSNYDPISNKINWEIPSFGVGSGKLDVIMKINDEGRFNLTPTLNTGTYDESIKNVANRYLTIKNPIVNENIGNDKEDNTSKYQNLNITKENMPNKNIVQASTMKSTANPILLLILLIFSIFIGSIKFKR